MRRFKELDIGLLCAFGLGAHNALWSQQQIKDCFQGSRLSRYPFSLFLSIHSADFLNSLLMRASRKEGELHSKREACKEGFSKSNKIQKLGCLDVDFALTSKQQCSFDHRPVRGTVRTAEYQSTLDRSWVLCCCISFSLFLFLCVQNRTQVLVVV